MLKINVDLYGYTQIDFDKKSIRRALRKEGAEVRKLARRLISRSAISIPGEYPGLDTGNTRRSLAVFLSKDGFSVIIAPRRTGQEKKGFFPTILVYGTEIIEPRPDYMEAALNSRRSTTLSALTDALQSSLKPV